MDGVDAVVSTVGSTIREVLTADELVDGSGVATLATAAVDAGVERFVFQSAIGVGSSRERAPLLYRVPIGRTLDAKERAEDVLRSVAVDETILRPGILTSGPARGFPLVAEGGDTVFGLISRADVARLLVASLWTDETVGRTFEVVSRRWTWGPVSGTVDVEWAEDYLPPIVRGLEVRFARGPRTPFARGPGTPSVPPGARVLTLRRRGSGHGT